uniref:AXH domain-containing protein n=1 Tax=Macrostomum lignano TaxID=282301 RepID=A0A1I8IT38_9PLAT
PPPQLPPPQPPQPQLSPALHAAALMTAFGLHPPPPPPPQYPPASRSMLHQMHPGGRYRHCLWLRCPACRLNSSLISSLICIRVSFSQGCIDLSQQQQAAAVQKRCQWRGTVLSIWGGRFKRVEELTLQDFELTAMANAVPAAASSASAVAAIESQASGFSLIHCRLVQVEDSRTDGTSTLQLVSIGAERKQTRSLRLPSSQPLFVPDKSGWSARDPMRAMEIFGLACGRLEIGDCIIALTPRLRASPVSADVTAAQAAGLKSNQHRSSRKRSHSPS